MVHIDQVVHEFVSRDNFDPQLAFLFTLIEYLLNIFLTFLLVLWLLLFGCESEKSPRGVFDWENDGYRAGIAVAVFGPRGVT